MPFKMNIHFLYRAEKNIEIFPGNAQLARAVRCRHRNRKKDLDPNLNSPEISQNLNSPEMSQSEQSEDETVSKSLSKIRHKRHKDQQGKTNQPRQSNTLEKRRKMADEHEKEKRKKKKIEKLNTSKKSHDK